MNRHSIWITLALLNTAAAEEHILPPPVDRSLLTPEFWAGYEARHPNPVTFDTGETDDEGTSSLGAAAASAMAASWYERGKANKALTVIASKPAPKVVTTAAPAAPAAPRTSPQPAPAAPAAPRTSPQPAPAAHKKGINWGAMGAKAKATGGALWTAVTFRKEAVKSVGKAASKLGSKK